MSLNKHFLITIDVEDWFQVENFKGYIPFETWDQRELRVEKNVHHLLDLLDAVTLPNLSVTKNIAKPIISKSAIIDEPSAMSHELSHGHQTAINMRSENSPKATFFVLGWLAQRLPHLVREIQSRGHEVASHGLIHELCNKMTAREIIEDVRSSRMLLEDILGSPIYGYRAPSFSIDNSILKYIEKAGYLYDSSYNSFRLHNRYGQLKLSGTQNSDNPIKISKSFYEIPISNLKIGGQCFPFGGGAYFRLMPYKLYQKGVEAILTKDGVYSLYLHPWEFDPDQPIVRKAALQYKIRHYTNLKRSTAKLFKLIKHFSYSNFSTCCQFIEQKQKL